MTIPNKRLIASVLFVLISFGCMALGADVPDVPPPGAPVPPGLPIDGGVLLGVITALFYGAKRIISKKSNN